MKTTGFVLAGLLFFSFALLKAQTGLPVSGKGSVYSYIYKVSSDNLKKIHLKEYPITDEMLGEYVTQYKVSEGIFPELNRGNYIIVKAIEDQLYFTCHTEDDLHFRMVPSEHVMLCLYDSQGNIIEDAVVKYRGSKIPFDKRTKTYNRKSVRDEAILEINHQGVYHYIEINKERYYRYKQPFFQGLKRKTRNFWYRSKWRVKSVVKTGLGLNNGSLQGFVAFNKPIYKPGETVKLKAYMGDNQGKPYNKPVNLHLSSYYPVFMDTVLTRLSPYRPGMYEYQFNLSDSLDLKLDKDYSIRLQTKHKKGVSDRFRYEDYELKSVRFSMTTEKEKYIKGDSIKLTFNVSDENDLAVYDGKIDVLVVPELFSMYDMNKCEIAFIPDTLWKYTLEIDGNPDRELIIPDTVFPTGASLSFRVEATYLSADNEKRQQTKTLKRIPVDHIIDFSLMNGILTVKELCQGVSQAVKAEIQVNAENGEKILADTVMLPYSFPLPWIPADIKVTTQNVSEHFRDQIKEDQLTYRFYRYNDSVYLQVNNPANIPFWYTVRRMNKEIAKGYTTALNYAVKDKGKSGYSMKLSYLLGEEDKTITGTLPFTERNISMDISMPTTVYPGQTAKVDISVTDKKGNPVKDVDITAYSFTSKFQNYSMPRLRIHGKVKQAKQFSHRTVYEADEDQRINRKQKMEWDKWKHIMGLDTIAYYNFIYPDVSYEYKENTPDRSTLIAPYLVIDGVLQGIQMLWIDERLFYFKDSEHLNPYLFPVAPGRHNFRFRTYNRDIQIHNVYVHPGKKNIFSFDVADSYTDTQNQGNEHPFYIVSRLLKKEEWGKLTQKEINQLSSQLITVDNNFGILTFPGHSQVLDLPVYIKAGRMSYYLNHESRTRYNYALKANLNKPVLVGPFPYRAEMNGVKNIASIHVEDDPAAYIGIEGGYKYTFYKDYQKLKSWEDLPFKRTFRSFKPQVDFTQTLITPLVVRQLYQAKVTNLLTEYSGRTDEYRITRKENKSPCRMTLYLNREIKPALIYIKPQEKERLLEYQLYYGGTRRFTNLPAGDMMVTLVFSDSTSYSKPVTFYPDGHVYLRLDSIMCEKNNPLAREAQVLFDRGVKKEKTKNPYITNTIQRKTIVTDSIREISKPDNSEKGNVTGIVFDSEGDPIIGASVKIDGTTTGTITNIDGYFELSAKEGDKILITYLGYKEQSFHYKEGTEYRITLKENAQHLDEVVVVGYGVTKKQSVTGAVTSVNTDGFQDLASLSGYSPGLMIRGTNPVASLSQPPLILINGVPYEGLMEDLDPAAISSINVLKDATSTAIYGSRAANGVIMIEMNGFGINRIQNNSEENDLLISTQESSIRRNFHDDAFWQPRLKTNEKGEVSFKITYPDDITRWNAYFIAVGKKKQTDRKELSVRSFKTLTGRLSLPRFAIRGDSINGVGRITNHLKDTIQIQRNILIDDTLRKEELNIVSTHVDYIPVKAQAGDSLTVTYSLDMENGYFDGEERSIPILEQGLFQTYGDFKVINDTSVHLLEVKPDLGEVTIYAEVSGLDLFLREIEKVDIYPYMCNEQMASKIKVLLSKKRIAQMFGKEFKEDKKIKELIKRLHKNRNENGLWGWWNRDKSEFWISRHIAETLLDAKHNGFDIEIHEENLWGVYFSELEKGIEALNSVNPVRLPLAKQELLDRLIFLKRLNAPVMYDFYFNRIHERLPDKTSRDKLKTMQAMSMIGLEDQISVDSLMKYSHTTLTGSLYWGEKKKEGLVPFFNILPYRNDTEQTLIAYEILRSIGGHEKEMEKIQNYFFECRRSGFWQNTYEASRIIETIMPDVLKSGAGYTNVSMYVNDKKVTDFPYTGKLLPDGSVQIRKEGTLPVFVTAYQQAWNEKPQSESSKGFKVETRFVANKDTVSYLKAGITTKLEVTVQIDGSAEYVQIEVPIPAGCTYDSKNSGSYWKEIHREHFKDKVVIFCSRLPAGKHHFTVELLPRYSGYYSLNPAKAELMYFPTYYGNEEIKSVRIE